MLKGTWGSGGTVDTLVLGTSAEWREGSNPSFPTKSRRRLQAFPHQMRV